MANDRFHIIKSRYGYKTLNEIYLFVNELSKPKILFNPYGFVEENGDIKNNWAIYLDPDWRSYNFYIMGLERKKEAFIAALSEDYPDDLVWLLFHPEVFDGEFYG